MSQRTKQNHRRKDFKKGLDGDDARRKREDGLNSIRKKKQLEQLEKRRRAREPSHGPLSTPDDPNGEAPGLDRIDEMRDLLMSDDPVDQLNATVQFRRWLSVETNPPIQQVIKADVVPRFVEFLQSTLPKLQFEAAWALTNIASGTTAETRVVVNAGAVPIFVQLLRSPRDQVREQAIWALGNIAGDSPHWRDHVLNFDAMKYLLSTFLDQSRDHIVRNAIWTLSNFCRGKPAPRFERVEAALPVLAFMIRSEDAEVLADACWALSYLSDGRNENIQAVIDADVCDRLVELLGHPVFTVQTPALRCIGNVVTGDDHQTQHIIRLNALPALARLLNSPKRAIRKETCWTLSNITAGNTAQIQAVFDARVIPKLVHMLSMAPLEIKKEVCWCLSNATSGGTAEQIQFLVESGVIAPLCNMLSSPESKIVTVALEGLENILEAGENNDFDYNIYARRVEELEGTRRLEALHSHRNNEVYTKAMNIVTRFFDYEVLDEEAEPEMEDDGTVKFSFQGTGGGF